MVKRLTAFICIPLLLATLTACGSPEEKKMKFFNKGEALYEQEDYVKAALEFKNALQIDPKFARGYYMLGMIEEKQGNFRGAYGAFMKAVELDPELMDAQLELGRIFLLARNTDKAGERIDIVLAKDPANAEALILKASKLLIEQKSSAAISILEDLLAGGNTAENVYITLAAAYAQQKDLQKAEAVYRSGLKSNPDSLRLLLTMARFFSIAGQPDEAAKVLKKVIDLEPDNPVHKISLASVYWDADRRDEADNLIAALISADSTNETIIEQAMRFYASKKQVQKAIQTLTAGIERNPESLQLRISLGKLYTSLNQPNEALKPLQECLTLNDDPANPGIIDAKNALAAAYLMLRQIDKAETYVNEVLQENPKSIEGHFNKGSIYLLKGDGVNAVSEFRTVVTERPQAINGYIRLANAHILSKELALAEDTLQKALKINPQSKEVLHALARVYVMKKDDDAAESQLKKILEIDPNDMGVRADLGDFLLARKNPQGAEAQYAMIVKAPDKDPHTYLRLSRFYQKLNKPEEALAVLAEGYGRHPRSTALLTGITRQYVRQKKYDQAVAVCEERILQDPRDAFSYNLLGWVYAEKKEYQKAEQALLKAMEIQPMWPSPLDNLAKVYLVQGKKNEAIARYEAAIKARPDNGQAYLALGLLYEGDRDLKNAARVYEQALEQNPDFWFASNNLAFLICEQSPTADDLDKALGLAQYAQNLRPNDPAVLDTVGWIYYHKQDFIQARGYLERALAAAPAAPVLNFHMGMVLYKTGHIDEAKAKLEKALEADENFYGRETAEATLKELG